MTYLQLKNRLTWQSHRSDLTNMLPSFVEDARMKINQRLGLELIPLVSDGDENEVMLKNYLLYYYAALESLYNHIIEMETANYFAQLFEVQADGWYVTASGTEPLTITPENPAP